MVVLASVEMVVREDSRCARPRSPGLVMTMESALCSSIVVVITPGLEGAIVVVVVIMAEAEVESTRAGAGVDSTLEPRPGPEDSDKSWDRAASLVISKVVVPLSAVEQSRLESRWSGNNGPGPRDVLEFVFRWGVEDDGR